MRKNITALLAASTILLSFLGSALYASTVKASGDSTDWYMTVNGVLTSDTYSLYPYRKKSIDLGFSKFGELINYNWDTEIGVGLQYPGYESVGTYDQALGTSADPFANELVDAVWWMNGWFIDVKYRLPTGDWREIWAFAMFSDSKKAGGDWITMPEVTSTNVARPLWQEYAPYANPDADAYSPSLGDAYKGGRKTNGVCTTEDIEVLYDGPRKFIALLKTTVGDITGTGLVRIELTIIFNKVKKSVILLKDVKRLYDKGILNIQFGDRGEWDLHPPAYVHFYTDEPVQWWDLNGDGVISDTEKSQTGDIFNEYMTTNKNPKKWWQDVPRSQTPDDASPEWYETQYTCYGREWHSDQTIKDHGYAVAQVIDEDLYYVGALAVWPHPEFWSVQNYITVNQLNEPLMLRPISRMLDWHKWESSKTNVWVKLDDMYSEPEIPFIIYEHDFELALGVRDQYRIASAYVVTDWHDADDADMGVGHSNVIDREIQFQLDEIFNPWDIRSAVHKDTKRWVEFFEGDGLTYCFYLKEYEYLEAGLWVPTLPVTCVGAWDAYCSFSEKIIVDVNGDGVLDTLFAPYEAILAGNWLNYPYYYTIDRTTGVFYLWNALDYEWVPPDGALIKVLWSSPHTATKAEVWDLTDWDCLDTFPLHHSVIKGTEEVFYVYRGYTADVLQDGAYVYCEVDGYYWMTLQDSLSSWSDWLWVTDGQNNELVHYSDAWDTACWSGISPHSFETEFLTDVEPIYVYSTTINETYIDEDTFEANPIEVGDTYLGGIVVGVSEDPYGGYYEVEAAHKYYLLPHGDYVIHETCTCDELVLDEDALLRIVSKLSVSNGNNDMVWELKIVYEVASGRYEWTIVGRNADSVDSVGAALVTAAIKNKNLEIGMAGVDMSDPETANLIPWIMHKFGDEDEWQDYYYNKAGLYVKDNRTAIKDDWCTTWPISSSNVIGVGGPLANLLAYYDNDFSEALYGMPAYAGTSWSGMIAAATCWSKNTYASDSTTGYAVITTYKDINGTVLFLIWGHWGRDTFYACRWFDYYKFQLQHLNPHITSIILEIDYTDPEHPVTYPVEFLGTISEKSPHEDP